MAAARGVPLVFDAGSGLLRTDGARWARDEPTVPGALHAGADLAICSGDKLLGGPQAGLLVGAEQLVTRCRAHPLARALRLDKLRIAALTATLEAHLRGTREELPVWRMLEATTDDLAVRAQALASAVGGTVVTSSSVVGAGSAPGRELDSPVCALAVDDADRTAARLRSGRPAVLTRVEDDRVIVDPRTVAPEDDAVLTELLRAATTDS